MPELLGTWGSYARTFGGLGGGMPELLWDQGGGMPELLWAQGRGMPELFWAHGEV